MQQDTAAVDGWDIGRTETGRWRAVRQTPLDDRQRSYCCLDVLTADSYGELELFICAETIKVSLIEAAWRLVTRMREADRIIAQDIDERRANLPDA